MLDFQEEMCFKNLFSQSWKSMEENQPQLAQIDASNVKMHGILKVSGKIKIINLYKLDF